MLCISSNNIEINTLHVSNATVAKDCSNSISGYSGSALTELFVFLNNSASMPVDVSGPFPSKISTIGLKEIKIKKKRK